MTQKTRTTQNSRFEEGTIDLFPAIVQGKTAKQCLSLTQLVNPAPSEAIAHNQEFTSAFAT